MSSLRNRQTFHSKCGYFQKKMNLQFTRFDMFYDVDIVCFLHWKYFIQNLDHFITMKRMDKYSRWMKHQKRGWGKSFLLRLFITRTINVIWLWKVNSEYIKSIWIIVISLHNALNTSFFPIFEQKVLLS